MDKGDGGDQVDQLAELGLVDLQATVLFIEHPFELGVILLIASSAASISRPTLRIV
jgi:hypothetical protein